jgi:hypothetical protein
MRAAIPTHPHMPSWRVHILLYLYAVKSLLSGPTLRFSEESGLSPARTVTPGSRHSLKQLLGISLLHNLRHFSKVSVAERDKLRESPGSNILTEILKMEHPKKFMPVRTGLTSR